MSDRIERTRGWREKGDPRYWWHRLPGMDFTPPIYSDLSDEEWNIVRDWYADTDRNHHIGECAVPLMSLLQGLVVGNGARRIVQLGTCSGYSTLLLGFMLRRMDAKHGLFTLDIGGELTDYTREWLTRAGLNEFVEAVELSSLDPAAPARARDYFSGAPEVVVIDSSHEHGATLRELEIWYDVLESGGVILLHDVSQFATHFDVTKKGGVERAFDEWRRAHPNVEAMCINRDARSMDLPRPFYKDACGVGLIQKPLA
ncbi:MAG: O-methyltransferase [Chthoniobacterales bacterium]